MTRRKGNGLGGVLAPALALILIIIASSGSQLQNIQAAGSNLSNTPGPSAGPRMVISGDSVYLVWEEFTDSNLEIFFASSTDGGTTFSESVNLSNTLDGSSNGPKIAAADDNVYVVWQDTFPANDIFFAASTDGGATFSEPINVSNSSASASPQLAASGDNVYLAWEDSALGNPDIFFAASTDGGATFSESINVSNTTDGFSSTAQLAVSENGIINLAWVDAEISTDIFLASSTDGGTTFSEPINVSNTEGGAPSLSGIAATGDSVYVVWQDVIPGIEIFLASSTDGGTTFSDPVNVSVNEGISVSPVLSVHQADPSSIYVAWVDDTDTGGSFDIFFASSTDSGSTFSEIINVSNTNGSSTNPRVVVDSAGNVTVGWSDSTLDPSHDEVLVAVSGDGGATFGSSVNISNNPTSSALAQLVVSPTNETLNILWVDQVDQIDPQNTDILLQTGLDTAIPSITIDSVSTSTPRWDVDSVEVFGTVGNPAAGDHVTVDWGDGTAPTTDIPVSGSSWGPVTHTYSASAIAGNPNQITAQLFRVDDVQKAISEPTEVIVQKHSVNIALDTVLSAREGAEITASGVVTDSDTGDDLEGLTIDFVGSGAEGIFDSATTDSDGTFASVGVAPSPAAGLTVQAQFGGNDSLNASDSVIRIYDSVSESAVPFNVTAGVDSHVDLTGFGFDAFVDYEEVIADGALFASECDSPESSRYDSLGMCLQLSSAVQMAENTSAFVTMSFAEIELPQGSTASDVDMFHEHSDSIVDITKSRDETDETVTGKVTEFSKFIAGIAVHTEIPASTQRQQVFVGDGNVVSIRADKQGNSSATVDATFDKARYRITERPILTIIDENGNLDSSRNDTILAAVMSDTSSPFNIIIPLTESGQNSSSFSGDFGLDKSVTSSELGVVQIEPNDQLSTFYLSGGRAQAVIDGVSESGPVDLSDFIVDEGVCFKPIGGAIDLELVDSQLGPDAKITFTLSYANANLRGFEPSSFRMVHKEVATWVDRTVSVDTDAMTVTGESTMAGPFTVAVDFGSCGGGAGGGLARPGSGLVVDFVASLVSRSSGGGGGGGSTTPSAGTDLGQPTSTEVVSGNDVQAVVSADKIVIEFSSVLSEGSIFSKELSPDDLPAGSFSEVRDNGDGIMSIDESTFQTVGVIYDLTVSHTLSYNGSITLTLPYNESELNQTGLDEQDLRLVHYINGQWEDTTISIDMNNNTVTGELTSLSPVAVASVNDGTFNKAYFEVHPLSMISLPDIKIVDGDTEAPSNEVTRGRSVTISADLHNNQRVEQPYIFVVQVSLPTGVVDSIVIDSGTLGSGDSSPISAKWESGATQELGTYTVMLLIISSLDEPQILSQVATSHFELVAGE